MKPILFNTEMVRAILDGRKTVTRRIVKPQPVCYGPNKTFDAHEGDFFLSAEKNWIRCRMCGHDPEYSREGSEISHHWEPPYVPGDILYVRETWTKLFYVDPDGYTHFDKPMLYYAADGTPDIVLADEDGFELDDQRVRWKSSIHMPKEVARIFLRVTDVRVERLQDIDGEQAFMEGATAEVPGILESFEKNDMSVFPTNFSNWSAEKKADWYRSTAAASYIAQCELSERLIQSFKQIWNSTIKSADLPTYGWEANPWVWVYEFERISKEEVPNADMQ